MSKINKESYYIKGHDLYNKANQIHLREGAIKLLPLLSVAIARALGAEVPHELYRVSLAIGFNFFPNAIDMVISLFSITENEDRYSQTIEDSYSQIMISQLRQGIISILMSVGFASARSINLDESLVFSAVASLNILAKSGIMLKELKDMEKSKEPNGNDELKSIITNDRLKITSKIMLLKNLLENCREEDIPQTEYYLCQLEDLEKSHEEIGKRLS